MGSFVGRAEIRDSINKTKEIYPAISKHEEDG